MGVHARRLVFGEEGGIRHFADVVVQGACSYQRGIRAQLGGCGHCQIGYLQGVLEGAGCLFGELFQQRFVDIGEFHQRNTGDEPEGFLHKVDQRIGKHDENEIDEEVDQNYPVDFVDVSFLVQFQPDVHHDVGEQDEEGAFDQLRTLRQLFQHEDGNHGHRDLDDDELERERHHERTCEDGGEAGEQCRARVDKSADEDGDDGVGEDVDAEKLEAHGNGGEQYKGGDEQHHEHHVLAVAVFYGTEIEEERVKCTEHGEDEHELPQKHPTVAVGSSTTFFGHPFEGGEYIIGLRVYNLTLVDDALPPLHKTVADVHLLDEFVLGFFGYGVVV